MGRSREADITIPDANLSRSHCSITATPQGYMLEDLGSTNGTQVNGKRVKQAVLREGDHIVLGETEMEFRVSGRFDDSETKMDLVPVDMPEEVTPEEALKMVRTPPAGRPKHTARLKRARFCDVCDVNIPRPDVDSGAAREIAGQMLCAECISRLEGKNLDAAASLEHVLDALRAEVRREKGKG